MSKFTQEEEVELVKYCRDLTATIECEEKELSSISKERFVDKPNPPVKKIAPLAEMVKPQYPKKPRAQYMYKEYLLYLIKNKLWLSGVMALYLILLIVSFVNIGFWLTVFGWSWIPVLVLLVLTIVFWQRKRRHLDAELAKKPEYLQAVATAENVAMQLNNEAEARVRAIQKAYDEEFDNQMNEYNNVIIPKYNKELEAWTIFHNRKMDVLREEISLNKNTLKETYDTSKLISSTYRELKTLIWLYEDMSTSDHDIRYSTELYDRDRQRAITEAAALAVRQSVYDLEDTMRVGFDAVYDAIEYGNTLTEKEVSILTKTRRDQNIANIIGIGQMHKQNKMLSDLLPEK